MVRTPRTAPVVGEFPDPIPGDGEEVVEILAAGIHPIVRALASGEHYGSHGLFPFVPGVDAVARMSNGSRAYVGFARPPYGTLSDLTVIPAGWGAPLPDGDGFGSAVIAGTLNPLAAVWMALVHRAELAPGARVLILGATGISGQLAVPMAFEHGAAEVVAVGRNPEMLAFLTDPRVTTVQLRGDPAADAAALTAAIGDGVDVVLDYLWGPVAEAAIAAISRRGLTHRATPTRWVQVGEMSGPQASIPAAALRSSGWVMLGSGAGSVSPEVIGQAIPGLIELVGGGKFRAPVREVSYPEAVTGRNVSGSDRLVLVP